MKHNFQSTDLQKFFGGGIHDYFNWNVDLKNFDIECVLFVQVKENLTNYRVTNYT